MVGGDGGLVDASARSRPVLVPYPSHQKLCALSSSRIGAGAGHDSPPHLHPASAPAVAPPCLPTASAPPSIPHPISLPHRRGPARISHQPTGWVPAGWVHARVRGGNKRRWRPGLVRLDWGRASSRERTSACSPSARSRHQPWQVRVSSSERRGRTASGGKRPIPRSGWAGCIC